MEEERLLEARTVKTTMATEEDEGGEILNAGAEEGSVEGMRQRKAKRL